MKFGGKAPLVLPSLIVNADLPRHSKKLQTPEDDRRWDMAQLFFAGLAGRLLPAFVLAGCAATPDIGVTYFLATTDLAVEVNRTAGCNTSDILMAATSARNIPRHSTDTSEAHTFDIKKLDGFLAESGLISSLSRKNDFLAIVYNSSRLRHVETIEIQAIRSRPGEGRLGKTDGGLRGALVARFYDWETGTEFYVGNVHLKCGGEDGPSIREHQAAILQQWIKRAEVSGIFTGDSNIPVEVDAADGNQSSAAFQILATAMSWQWPTNPVKTQCHPSFNTMLDHFFVRSGGRLSVASVQVQIAEPSHCSLDEQGYSDHRSVKAVSDLTPRSRAIRQQRCLVSLSKSTEA